MLYNILCSIEQQCYTVCEKGAAEKDGSTTGFPVPIFAVFSSVGTVFVMAPFDFFRFLFYCSTSWPGQPTTGDSFTTWVPTRTRTFQGYIGKLEREKGTCMSDVYTNVSAYPLPCLLTREISVDENVQSAKGSCRSLSAEACWANTCWVVGIVL